MTFAAIALPESNVALYHSHYTSMDALRADEWTDPDDAYEYQLETDHGAHAEHLAWINHYNTAHEEHVYAYHLSQADQQDIPF